MVLEGMLEARDEKFKQKYVFPNLKRSKNLTKISLTASQQPLFFVPEHNTHPVDTIVT